MDGAAFVSRLKEAVDGVPLPVIRGTVTMVHEWFAEALLPGAGPGAVVKGRDGRRLRVAAVNGDTVRMAPLCGPDLKVGDEVMLEEATLTIPCGDGLLSRVIDPLGRPIDDRGPLKDCENCSTRRQAPNPLARRRVDVPFVTGLRVLDGLLAIGRGQRIGLFAGPGQGKSTLLGELVSAADCDGAVVCLVGERGREAGEFVHDILCEAGLSRSVVVLATSDAPAALRCAALETATSIAEWQRDQGRHVLLLVDSLTRVVRAKRDLDAALGQVAGPSGYPATAFSALPGLLERAGCDGTGSITGVYTVLTERDGDDPVGQEVQSLLDGHVVLSAARARAGRWPAVDVVRSVSRVMRNVVDAEHLAAAEKVRAALAAWDENADLVLIGAYREGTSREMDAYLRHRQAIEAFLTQKRGERSALDETRAALRALAKKLS